MTDDLMLLPESTHPEAAVHKRKQHGNAALPGSGPAGETCGSCFHLRRIVYAKTYLKCSLMRAYWTSGIVTDVKAADAACRRWEPEGT